MSERPTGATIEQLVEAANRYTAAHGGEWTAHHADACAWAAHLVPPGALILDPVRAAALTRVIAWLTWFTTQEGATPQHGKHLLADLQTLTWILA
jgi:hypothetical protein